MLRMKSYMRSALGASCVSSLSICFSSCFSKPSRSRRCIRRWSSCQARSFPRTPSYNHRDELVSFLFGASVINDKRQISSTYHVHLFVSIESRCVALDKPETLILITTGVLSLVFTPVESGQTERYSLVQLA